MSEGRTNARPRPREDRTTATSPGYRPGKDGALPFGEPQRELVCKTLRKPLPAFDFLPFALQRYGPSNREAGARQRHYYVARQNMSTGQSLLKGKNRHGRSVRWFRVSEVDVAEPA